MGNGWIKLHRKLLEKGYWNKSQYVHLWVHLLLIANHKQKEFMWNGSLIMVKEGQVITGRKELSSATGIPETTIERILQMLESEHQIGQQKTNKYRLITILNWEQYQNRTPERTTSGQQADTNKNDKNEKEDSEVEDDVRREVPDDELDRPVKLGNKYTKKYQELCDWMESLTGVRFVDRRGQYKALKLAREADIGMDDLKERAQSLWDSGKFEKDGMDWFNVVYSFNKKGV